MNDRVDELRDFLAKIALRDVKRIDEMEDAVERMLELGYIPPQLDAFLETETVPQPYGQATPGFYGFKDRRQCAMAYMATQVKHRLPGFIQHGQDRICVMLKKQETQEDNETTQLIVIPGAMMVTAGPVKEFRRLRSGKLKELAPRVEAPVEESVLDVEEVF